jgi:hypothetical protein
MKTSIKLALVAFGVVAMGAAMPLASFADDATPEGGGSNCSNMRTITNSRCVHYNEKARDGYANQHASEGKASPGSPGRGSPGTVTVYPPHYSDSAAEFAGTAHVNYNDIMNGRATVGGGTGGSIGRNAGGSGGSRGGTSAK